jgi:murein hydrolase activator
MSTRPILPLLCALLLALPALGQAVPEVEEVDTDALVTVDDLAEPTAEDSPATRAVADAEAAAALLRAALSQLAEAVSADDQVVALTEVIRGYELGLSALREGLRQAHARELELRGRFEAQRSQLAQVLGAMTALQQSPESTMLLHPAGAVANARSAMILSDVTPGLRAQAEALQGDLDEIATVRELQASAAAMLGSGLASVQEARRLLASAAGDRSSMPARYAEEPAELQSLREAADSLDAFASGIARMEKDVGAPMEDFEGAQGSLRLPAVGTILRPYNEPDAAGVPRPGWVIATAPAALVQTPWPATIRYRTLPRLRQCDDRRAVARLSYDLRGHGAGLRRGGRRAAGRRSRRADGRGRGARAGIRGAVRLGRGARRCRRADRVALSGAAPRQ